MDIIRRPRASCRAEIAQFGQRVRDPSVVGDRWNLIIELQSFRFQFRNRIGSDGVRDGVSRWASASGARSSRATKRRWPRPWWSDRRPPTSGG